MAYTMLSVITACAQTPCIVAEGESPVRVADSYSFTEGPAVDAGDGVTVFDKSGQQIAHFPIPEDWTANVCFGGKERNILFITASKSVYTLKMLVHGVAWSH